MDFQGPTVPALFARVRMPGNFDDRSAGDLRGDALLRIDNLRDISRINGIFYANFRQPHYVS